MEEELDGYDQPTESSGWDVDVSFNLYSKNKNIDETRIIREANRRIPLGSIIFRYIKQWEVRHSVNGGWTHKCSCPFPDHNDSTPSFGYNSEGQYFKCLGCNKAGGSVQFVAYMEGISWYKAAMQLLSTVCDDEELIVDFEDKPDKTDDILAELSDYVRNFIHKNYQNKEAMVYVEKVMMSLDMYLEKHFMYGTIKENELTARCNFIKNKLNLYGAK